MEETSRSSDSEDLEDKSVTGTILDKQPSEDLTFRPIVGGPSAPTQRLSNLLDILLKPLCSGVKSYVQDDFDFLRHLPEKVENNSKLVTLDVINLYRNISSSLGLEAVDYWISKNPGKIKGRFTKDFISEALLEVSVVLLNKTK